MFERWTYLVSGAQYTGDGSVRARVGRSRRLVDFFELGARVATALELEGFGRLELEDVGLHRAFGIAAPAPIIAGIPADGYGIGASIATAPRNALGEHPVTFA